MCKALYIEDEKTAFVLTIMDELKKRGIVCKFQYWGKAAENARVDNEISFEKLYEKLEMKSFDLLILDVMMPTEGLKGTQEGYLTGMILHKKLLGKVPEIIELKTFFITSLPANEEDNESYYKQVKDYVEEDDTRRFLYPKDDAIELAEKIKKVLSGSEA